MAEIMGLEARLLRRARRLHAYALRRRASSASAIIGGNLPHAAATRLADKMLGRDQVSVAFFGDGTPMAGRRL